MANSIANVTLPGGAWIDGARRQSAEVRALTGADEEYLRGLDPSASPAARTTGLLARCVARLGPLSPVPSRMIGELSVGDREALLLHVRRLTFGERMQCLLDCPACGEKLDVALTVSQLLVEPYPEAPGWHEATVRDSGGEFTVRFRVPQGADQEAVAEMAKTDPQQAARALLRRCIDGTSEEGDSPAELPGAVGEHVAAMLPRHDPQAELRLSASCPGCKGPISALLDAASFLFQELEMRVRDVYREVHTLALYYHWSEKEILDMTAPRRRRYLDLIAESAPRQGA